PARDPDLGNTGMAVLGRVLKAELKRTGSLTEEQLNTIPNDMNGVRAMAFATATLRAQGHRNVRDFDGLLDATGAELTRKFNLRPGRIRSETRGGYRIGTQAEIDARNERKRSMMSQPRSADMRMAPQQEYQRPKPAAEIVAQARRARGFDR